MLNEVFFEKHTCARIIVSCQKTCTAGLRGILTANSVLPLICKAAGWSEPSGEGILDGPRDIME